MPTWPLTVAPLLNGLKAAFKRRSKAISHKVMCWSCERLADEDENGPCESLLVVFDDCDVGPVLRLRVWQDGEVWFHVSEFVGGHWTFEFSFRAHVEPHELSSLVAVVEKTMVPASVRESSGEARALILDRWHDFEPYDIDEGRG